MAQGEGGEGRGQGRDDGLVRFVRGAFSPIVIADVTLMYVAYLILCVLSVLHITHIGRIHWREDFKAYVALVWLALQGKEIDV